MSIRSRPPGFSPFVCIRSRHSQLRFYQTPNTTSQTGRGSTRGESFDIARENRTQTFFSSVLTKHNVQGGHYKKLRFQYVSESQRPQFSTSTRQQAGSAPALEEENFDTSAKCNR